MLAETWKSKWKKCGGECVTPVHVRLLDTCPQPVTGLVSRLVFPGLIPVPHTNLVVSKTSEADIRLSSYEHLPDVGGQWGGCQQLSQRKGACFLLNKKETLSGLIQGNDDEERNSRHAGRVYGCQL